MAVLFCASGVASWLWRLVELHGRGRRASAHGSVEPFAKTQTHSPPCWPTSQWIGIVVVRWEDGSSTSPNIVATMNVDPTDPTHQIDDAQEALAEARQRIGEVPANVVVVNHVMGLYELAAIHLSAQPPRLADAALAIDAVACVVEGLGSRLGDEHSTLADALANIRLAFVQIKGTGA